MLGSLGSDNTALDCTIDLSADENLSGLLQLLLAPWDAPVLLEITRALQWMEATRAFLKLLITLWGSLVLK
jgi:hypothetical protein